MVVDCYMEVNFVIQGVGLISFALASLFQKTCFSHSANVYACLSLTCSWKGLPVQLISATVTVHPFWQLYS